MAAPPWPPLHGCRPLPPLHGRRPWPSLHGPFMAVPPSMAAVYDRPSMAAVHGHFSMDAHSWKPLHGPPVLDSRMT